VNPPKITTVKCIRYLVPLLLAAQSTWALNPHPRIWLTSTLLSTLIAKKNANTADWIAFKASADAYKVATVEAYSRGSCTGSDICYTYEGSGWFAPAITLALAYQITGDTSYSSKALQLLDAINAPWKNSSDLTPITLDDAYPTRYVLPSIALLYDWLYPLLSSTEKTDSIATINAAYGLWGSTYYQYNGPAYSNYFGGHMLGFGLAADATDGDNSSSAAIHNTMSGLFTLNMGYALQSDPVAIFPYSGSYSTTGMFNGGFAPQGYNYGTNHNIRMWQLILAWQTSGRIDLTATYALWMKTSVLNLIYMLHPDLWRTGDEADMPGECTGVLLHDYPLFAAYLLNGTTEGGWSQYLYNNLQVNPCDPGAAAPAPYETFLWGNPGRAATSYTNALGLNYASDGDGHLLARSDWTTSALYLSFNGGATGFTDHYNLTAGDLEVQRGSDYLLATAGQWKGANGYVGTPYNDNGAAEYSNTVYFNDGGTYDYTGAAYAGGQAYWGVTSILAQRTDANVSYELADLGTAYDIRPDQRVPANRTTRFYYRAVAYLGGNTIFVWDRFRSKSPAYTKRLQWHLNPTNPPSVNGSLVSTATGSSALFIDTLLPATPAITLARDIASDGSTPLTYNVQVSDSVSGTDLNALTVIYATTSGGSLPSTTSLGTIDTNHVGVQVLDSTPLVVVFAKTVQDNGNNTYTPLTYTSTTFTTTHSGKGKYLVEGLQAGTYSILQGGVALPSYSAVIVFADGTLTFSATSGSFSILPSGSTISPCDLNADGVVNNLDVQIAISQALGSSPCGNADLDRNGICNVIDVQRVINAANGQSCKLGP